MRLQKPRRHEPLACVTRFWILLVQRLKEPSKGPLLRILISPQKRNIFNWYFKQYAINKSKQIEPLHIVFRIQVLRKHMHVISSKSYQEILFTYIKVHVSIGARQEKYWRKHMWFRRRFLVNFQDICAIYNRWMISWLLPKVCTYIQ